MEHNRKQEEASDRKIGLLMILRMKGANACLRIKSRGQTASSSDVNERPKDSWLV